MNSDEEIRTHLVEYLKRVRQQEIKKGGPVLPEIVSVDSWFESEKTREVGRRKYRMHLVSIDCTIIGGVPLRYVHRGTLDDLLSHLPVVDTHRPGVLD